MIFALVLVAGLIGGLWAGVFAYAKRIERRFPPVGQLVDIGPGRLHCVEASPIGPERATVLLVHGASGNFADPFAALAEPLVARGFRVISVDRPGHGWSDRMAAREIATAPERQAEWIRAALRRLGVEKAIVVAHSLAGALGVMMAVDAPEFTQGLVLLAPASHPWPGGVSWYYTAATTPVVGVLFRWLVAPWAAHLMMTSGLRSVFAPDPIPPDYARRTRLALMLRPRHFLINAEDVADFEAHVRRLQPRYSKARAPTAILTGDRDQVVYADIHSFGCHQDIAGSTLRVIKELGHSPHFARPDEVIAAIEEVEARARGPVLLEQRAAQSGVLL